MTAQVKLVCDGTVRRQVHTFNGYFSLSVGGTTRQASVMDAGVGSRDASGTINHTRTEGFGGYSNPGQVGQRSTEMQAGSPANASLTGCELRAHQAGFQSESMLLTFRRPLDNPDVGTLVLYRAGSIVGTTNSVTTMAAPKKARTGYKKAKRCKRRMPTSRRLQPKEECQLPEGAELEKATDLYPEFSEGWNLLGQVRLQLKDEPGARKAFESATASDPKYLRPQVAMMELESRRRGWDQVSQWSTRVIELHPYHMQAHFYQGIASLNLRRLEQARESLTKVRASHQADDYPYAGYLLGLVLAEKGDFDAAAKELKHFLKLRPETPEGDRAKTFLSKWEEKDLIKGAKRN